MREWCIWYTELFLKLAQAPSVAVGWPAYAAALKLRTLKWSRVKKIEDPRVRYIVEEITSVLSEAAATDDALPGDFTDAVTAAERWRKALREATNAEEAAALVSAICDDMDVNETG